MNSTWDIIVVGAGPGGATAARGLSKAGLRVLLLEKEKIPRYKPCGGGLTAKVRDVLDVDFSPTIEDTIDQVSVAYGAERIRVNPVTAWCVMRDKFDMLLTEHAIRAGAEFRDASPVSGVTFDEKGVDVETHGAKLRAKIVVGADGANGIVRRAANIPAYRDMAVALEAEMEAPSTALEEWRGVMHLDFGAIPWGYGWIFPKAEHLSVGVGVFLRMQKAPDLRAGLVRYVRSEMSLRDAKEKLTRGHRIPIGGRFSTYHAARAVLVGDAAGVVDPFTAEGIYYAIQSGQIAAEEIVRAFQRGDLNLLSYTRRINAEIISDFRYAVWVAQIFYHMPHLAYRVLAKSVTTQKAATDIVSEPGSYRRALLGLVKKLPGMMRHIGKLK